MTNDEKREVKEGGRETWRQRKMRKNRTQAGGSPPSSSSSTATLAKAEHSWNFLICFTRVKQREATERR